MTFSSHTKLLATLTAAACLGLAGCNKGGDPNATPAPGTSTSPSPSTSTTPMPSEPTSTGGLPSAASAASAPKMP